MPQEQTYYQWVEATPDNLPENVAIRWKHPENSEWSHKTDEPTALLLHYGYQIQYLAPVTGILLTKEQWEACMCELVAKVMIRRTGAIRDHKGNVIINEQELLSWFKNGDHLKTYTDYDKI